MLIHKLLLQQISSLPPPWGMCDPLAGPVQSCMEYCRNRYVAKKCQCKAFYMNTTLDYGNY